MIDETGIFFSGTPPLHEIFMFFTRGMYGYAGTVVVYINGCTPSASLPSTKPRPFLSAKVKAVNTGDSKVSGYSLKGLSGYPL
jgi:hypothetical protein